MIAAEGSTRDQALAEQDIGEFFPGSSGTAHVNREKFRPTLLYWQSGAHSETAQRCVKHDPGHPLSNSAAAPTLDGRSVPDEDWILIRRAFSDYEMVDVRRLSSRKTGVGEIAVYRVQPGKNGLHDPIVFIVKIAPPEQIDREFGALEDLCGDKTPFPYFPPVARERCVSGRSRAALVSHFVDRAVQFERFIGSHSPALAVASLFDGPLRCWHAHALPGKFRLGAYMMDTGVVRRTPKAYNDAFTAAQLLVHSVSDPASLLRRLEASPEQEVLACASHGDLHLKNLRVRDNTAEVVLIDFARANAGAPISRDPAELEVSLAFDRPGKDEDDVDGELREQFYKPPLLARRVVGRNAHPRLLAIEQIRRQISNLVSEAEYSVMVAAHCLYYARRGDAAAYLAADRLI